MLMHYILSLITIKLIKIYNKDVNTCPSVIQFVSQCYKTQEMGDKAVDTCLFIFDFVLGQYKTQEMCNKTVDYFLPALKLGLAWFVKSKMIKKLHNAFLADDDVLFFGEFCQCNIFW